MWRSITLVLTFSSGIFGWVWQHPSKHRIRSTFTELMAASDRENDRGGRRDFLTTLSSALAVNVGASTIGMWMTPPPVLAAQQDEIDKRNIVKGYKRLLYLLENWEKETTVCNIGQTTTFGDLCERTPLKVMDYLGYKSTTDPLFKVEKTLQRLGDLVPPDQDGDYWEATETLLQNAEEANSMAFVSSWGEANPGGGKDRVQLFIERAKQNVIASKDSLATVIRILDIPI